MSCCEGKCVGKEATLDETVRGLILDTCSDLAKASIAMDAIEATLWDAPAGRLAAGHAGIVAVLSSQVDAAINQLRKIGEETGL